MRNFIIWSIIILGALGLIFSLVTLEAGIIKWALSLFDVLLTWPQSYGIVFLLSIVKSTVYIRSK